MNKRRVFIIGQSLFAETLMQLLSSVAEISIVGCASLVADAIPVLEAGAVDAIILVSDPALPSPGDVNELMAVAPNVSIIATDLDENTVQVITSKRVDARLSDLLSVLETLPDTIESQKLPPKPTNGGMAYET